MNKLAFAIIVFIVTVSFAFLFAVPRYQEYTALQTVLAKKQSDYEVKSAYNARILALQKEIQNRASDLEKVDNALPTDNSYASLIYFLQNKGIESGLAVKSVTFSQAITPYGQTTAKVSQPAKGIKNIFLTMSVSGTYQDLKKFLGTLDKSVRLFQVNSIVFNATQTAPTTKTKTKLDTYSVSMEIQTYTY